MLTFDEHVRVKALELAISSFNSIGNVSVEQVVVRAEMYRNYIIGGSLDPTPKSEALDRRDHAHLTIHSVK